MEYDHAMIGKIEKGKAYAHERERIKFDSFDVRIDGNNNSHSVQYVEGKWTCDCDFFQSRNVCGHTMAMERVLENMVDISA